MFTDMVKVLYKTDTPTNVLPSIHVFNSIGAGIAISHSNDLKKHRWIQISAYILAALIILSTMFLKQQTRKLLSFPSSRRNMNNYESYRKMQVTVI